MPASTPLSAAHDVKNGNSPVDVAIHQDVGERHAHRPRDVTSGNPRPRLGNLRPKPRQGTRVDHRPRFFFPLLALAQNLKGRGGGPLCLGRSEEAGTTG